MASRLGFSHIVLVMSIVLVLAGALGFVAYKNFYSTGGSVKAVDDNVTTDDAPAVESVAVCLTQERLCFNNPDGWDTDMHTVSIQQQITDDSGDVVRTVEQVYDAGTITSPSGAVELNIESVYEGIGGWCEPSDFGPIYVLKAEKLTPSWVGQSDIEVNNLYAVGYVNSDAAETEYRLVVMLTKYEPLTTVGQKASCTDSYANFYESKNAVVPSPDVNSADEKVLISVSTNAGAAVTNSLQSAEDLFVSDEYQQAFGLLASAYFE